MYGQSYVFYGELGTRLVSNEVKSMCIIRSFEKEHPLFHLFSFTK